MYKGAKKKKKGVETDDCSRAVGLEIFMSRCRTTPFLDHTARQQLVLVGTYKDKTDDEVVFIGRFHLD